MTDAADAIWLSASPALALRRVLSDDALRMSTPLPLPCHFLLATRRLEFDRRDARRAAFLFRTKRRTRDEIDGSVSAPVAECKYTALSFDAISLPCPR